MIRLLVGKRLGARLAGVGAGLDVPLVHGRGNLTGTKWRDTKKFWKSCEE
jgi:hypothetical protein